VIDGLHDFIIVDTSEKLMILKRDNEQRLKKYLQELEAKK